MPQLSLFGGVDLRRGEERLDRILAQPKRTALLVYLAAARPHGFHARDTLVSLFWPESDDRRARRSLRKTLHFLRRHLGKDAIVSRGDTLGLTGIQSDAAAFDEAVRAGRPRDALELYRGELLRGFHVSAAPDFEHWLDVERQRYRNAAARLAWSLAAGEEATGSPIEAVRLARRAHMIAPLEEPGLRRLMALLDRLGDRAGALRVYERAEKRIRLELGVEPARETRELQAEIVRGTRGADSGAGQDASSVGEPQALAPEATDAVVSGSRPTSGGGRGAVPDARSSLRTETDVPAAVGPRAPARSARGGSTPTRGRQVRRVLIAASMLALILTGPSLARRTPAAVDPAQGASSVAVLPFEADDATANSTAAALTELVTANVAAFAGIEVVDPSLVAEAARSDAADDPTPTAAAATMEEATGARWAVRGRVARARGGLLVSADVWDARRGTWTGPIRVEGADGVLALADRLTARLVAGRLAAADDLGHSDLHDGSTPSTEALRTFLDGERYFRRGQWPQAAERYWSALEQDTAFSMAYFRIADARGDLSLADAIRLYRRALAFPDRLRARDRSLIRGALLNAQRRRAAVDTLRALTSRHPFDAGAWNQLGAAYFHVGRRVLATPVDFRHALGRAIELDPMQVQPYVHLVEDAFFRGDESRARELVEGLRETAGETTYGVGFQVALDLAWGDAHEQRRALGALDSLSPRLRGPLARAMTLLELNPVFQGALVRVAEARFRLTRSEAERDNTASHLLRTYPRRGRAADGLAVLRSRMDRHGSRRRMARSILTWHTNGYRAPGYADEALAVLREVDQPSVRERFWLGAYGLAVGDSSLFHSQVAGLRALVGSSEALSPRPYVGLLADALEALAHAEQSPDRTIAVLQRAHDSRDPEITDDGVLDHIRFRLGQLYRETGRFDLALRHFRAQNHHADLYVALLELEQGRTLAAMGRHQDAATHYTRFAAWWADCDPGLRHLRDEALSALEVSTAASPTPAGPAGGA